MRRTLILLTASMLALTACAETDQPGVAPTTAQAPPATATPAAPATTMLATTTTAGPAPTTIVETDFPVTVTAANGDVTVETEPQRIISLSSTATETLFAIGAGAQVIAADAFSNYPAEAPTTELSGFDANIEALLAFEPDLVIVFFDPGELVSGLEAVGVPVLVQPAAFALEDVFTQIEQLGEVTGHPDEADALIDEMESDIDELVDSVPDFDEAPTYYHELDGTLYSVTSATFLGELYAMAGLENIADPADTDGFGYPQLSPEFIIEANPDLIFLADTICCAESAETVAARPGWGTIDAVVNGGVVELDDDIASRWGPRIVDLLRTIVEATIGLAG